jgi:AcrR family transcriptional regulator
MRRRAELVDATRERITAAAMRLHTTVGPSATSIAAIAAEAGVTRLTVYNHFANQDDIFAACMAHWAALHPRPDPAAWRSIPDLEERVRRGFQDLYGWYAGTGEDLHPIHRDIAHVPAAARDRIRANEAALAAALVGAGDLPDDGRRRLLAVAGHLVDVETWRSLVVEQGLKPNEAVDVAVTMLVALRQQVSSSPSRRSTRRRSLSGAVEP